MIINNITKLIGLFTAILVINFLFGFNIAWAADELGVSYSGDHVFNEDNIYPGWNKNETVTITNNHATEGANIYFTFDVKGDETLAGQLKLYVKRQPDNSYRIGGVGDHWTLRQADNHGAFYIDQIDPGGVDREYKIKIAFDSEAGNEYQDLDTEFDINFAIESEEVTAGQTEDEILADEGRIVTGEEPADEDPDVMGEQTSKLDSTEAEVLTEGISDIAGWQSFLNFLKNNWIWMVGLGSGFSLFFWYKKFLLKNKK